MNKIKIKIPSDNHYIIKKFHRKNIDIFNIEYIGKTAIYTIDEADLEKINIEDIEIISYRGLKSFIKKIKYNIHFIISCLIIILLLYFFGGCIIKVEVIHSNKDIRALLENELFSLGIKSFTFKKSFEELQTIKEHIKKEYPNDIEWLEIVDDGMKYTIRVEERIITEKKDPPKYCNIVSTKDAVIMNITSHKGQAILGINDHVKNGDIIVSGKIKFNEETKSHTCAEATVYGNTWYRVGANLPLDHETKEYTGKKKNNLAFEIGTKYTRIFKIHFDEYDVEKKCIFRLGHFAIYKETVKEYYTKKEKYTEEEAYNEALKQAKEKLEIKLNNQATILSEKVLQSNTYNSIISIDVFYSVKEIIGKQVEAQIEEEIEPKEPSN